MVTIIGQWVRLPLSNYANMHHAGTEWQKITLSLTAHTFKVLIALQQQNVMHYAIQ